MNFIADVAGEYDGLVRLLAKMPNEKTLFLGDLIDRGPSSREVVELVMSKHDSLLGNHEHMMIDWYRQTKMYEDGIWQRNGGWSTLENYGVMVSDQLWEKSARELIPEEQIKWMESRPLYFENEFVFASHAPWWESYETLDRATQIISGPWMNVNDASLIWNRLSPCKREFDGKVKLQISGHNSHWGLKKFFTQPSCGDLNDQKLYAICIDQSRKKLVTGLHVDDNTGVTKLFQESY